MLTMNRLGPRRLTSWGFLAVLALAAGACGDDTDGDASSATTTAAATPTAPAVTEPNSGSSVAGNDWMAEILEAHEADRQGTDRALPETSPVPEAGKKVWVISCGQAAEGCARGARGAEEAGELIGWDVTTFDGKLNPSTWNDGIRLAIADGADAVIMDVVDCGVVKSALLEAKQAGILVTAFYSLDCDDPTQGGGESVFDNMLQYGENFANYQEVARGVGAAKARAIIVETDGKAKVLQFNNDELAVVKYIMDGFEEEIAKCDTCEVLSIIDFVLADLGPPLTAKAQAALLKHADATAVVAPYDTAMLFIAPAIQQSGRNDDIYSIGGEGHAASISLIESNGGQDAATGIPSEWTGYAAIDDLNRMFHGEPTVDAGIGHQHIDKANLPKEGQYEGTVDFRSNYRKIWGVA